MNGQPKAAACSSIPQAGKPADASQDTIVNMLEIPGEFQVMLRVRIAELDRSQLRRMGVDLTHLMFDERHWASGGRGKSASAGIFENKEIRAVMNGLMANGTAKILSEPVLTVVSGHSASFLSGGEFAVPNVVGIDGVAGKQTSFHNFGTSLVVTPQVLDHDLIRMNIVPEFSQLNAGNTVDGIPGVDTRRAETTVQLREGQTIVLAGLISHKTVTETSHVRFLGDLPILGQKYFSGKRSKQDESELLILVTPELVRPMDADEVPPVPGHEVTAPNDCELYHCGMTEGAPDPTVYQVPPFGAGHSAGVPVGYHLFEQQACAGHWASSRFGAYAGSTGGRLAVYACSGIAARHPTGLRTAADLHPTAVHPTGVWTTAVRYAGGLAAAIGPTTARTGDDLPAIVAAVEPGARRTRASHRARDAGQHGQQ